jgi:integrase
MNDNDSTRPVRAGKPAKPYPEYPLTAHPGGSWCKKIRGKVFYFGPWSDPDGALKKYLEQKDALHAGRVARPDPDALTVKGLANAFLTHKLALLDAGELSRRSWADYKEVAELLVSHFGRGRLVADLAPDDFAGLRKKMAKCWGPVRLGNVIQRVRSVFKHALDADLLGRAVRFGPGFKRPSRKVLRLNRAAQGAKLFTREEVLLLLLIAPVHLEAMILLAINCGFGNTDCGRLLQSAVDLENRMIDFPRPKTGIPRRCPLWPETAAAIREALAVRPAPKGEGLDGLVFITRCGQSWARDTEPGTITREFRKLLKGLGINGHRNFYTLRHTFRTVADESKDSVACDFIMGHEVPHMSSVYRETISDERLRAVAEHVHAWLFGAGAE